jgi:hypothetical protein
VDSNGCASSVPDLWQRDYSCRDRTPSNSSRNGVPHISMCGLRAGQYHVPAGQTARERLNVVPLARSESLRAGATMRGWLPSLLRLVSG